MEKRDLPWRQNPTPYRVWISEVMLQQTQATVVKPYFERWMERFPTVRHLAEASVEQVMKLWEGLGYYSRARALHEGARYLMEQHGGELPKSAEELEKVKGLGPYTIGAIRSFAFNERAAAVDANVLRVISRLYCIEEEIDTPRVQKRIRELVQAILPEEEPWVAMEGLIELGAVICTKNPKCGLCPLREECLAYQRGRAEELPKKRAGKKITLLERVVLVIECEDRYLVKKQQKGKVMAGLYEFPYFEKGEEWKSFFPGKMQLLKKLKRVSHSFTRYKAELDPSLWKAESCEEVEGHEWVLKERVKELAFSSGHKRILENADSTH